jgi:hypothetical protein
MKNFLKFKHPLKKSEWALHKDPKPAGGASHMTAVQQKMIPDDSDTI